MPNSSDPTSLYRFSDDAGRLLYVGITGRGRERFHRHEQDKPWWHLVTLIEIEHYDDRLSALAAEERAIRTEHPAFNLEHRNDQGAAARRRQMRRTKIHIPTVDWDSYWRGEPQPRPITIEEAAANDPVPFETRRDQVAAKLISLGTDSDTLAQLGDPDTAARHARQLLANAGYQVHLKLVTAATMTIHSKWLNDRTAAHR